MSLPLEGIRVLDLTQVMAGPFCTMILGDLGADIIKIEPPGRGDMSRKGMGFFLSGDDTAAFLAINRNKRSVTVDLKSDEGKQILVELVKEADVLVENFRPGVTARLGIGYANMRTVNPRIIFASISGFGQTGPYAERAGFDLIAQGMSGIMSVTGGPDSLPVKCGIPISDLGAGLFCALGILSAYITRERTGEGQEIETSLFDAALALSVWETAELWATGRVPQPLGSAHRLLAPYQAVRTKDGHITIAANTQGLWSRLCETIERPDLIEDERFVTNEARMENRQVLVAEIEGATKTKATDEWVQLFDAVGFPAGPIYDYEQVFQDSHTIERRMLEEYAHPIEGTVKTLGIPVKFSKTPGAVRRHAPLLGEHTDEVLRETGFKQSVISDLHERGVI